MGRPPSERRFARKFPRSISMEYCSGPAHLARCHRGPRQTRDENLSNAMTASPETSTASSEEKLASIPGGIELEVTHTDGSKETVKVRQIQISKFQRYMLAIGTSDTAN